MANNGDIKFRVTLDQGDFEKGTNQIRQSIKGLEADAKSLDRAKGSISAVSTELSGLQALAARALPVAALGIAAREYVQIADQYAQITARLQLATKATGDFEAVQQGLRRAADETRAPLQDTVNLYSQIAPSLQGILNSQEIIGVLTTVNQAIALSGTSAQASSAALVQFTQGLASGTLRGEELNSILEQTPALADAIAEGLGVTRGELRQMGADGELATERVVQALQKVSGRVASDFQTLPVTVGQAFVLLNNSVTEFVGALDKGTGVTAGIANAIIAVGSSVDSLAKSTKELKPVLDVAMNSIDIFGRFVRALGASAKGTAAVIDRLLSFDLKGATEEYKKMYREVIAIAKEPLASQKADDQKPQREANARLEIERKLAAETEKLEKLKSVASGKASADILKDAKQVADERTKITQQAMNDRLKIEQDGVDKLRDLLSKTVDGAQKARGDAVTARTAGADAGASLRDKAAERRGAGVSEGEREELNTRAASTLTARATLTAGDAQVAVREGDLKKAAKLSADAAKLAQRAEQAADAIQDDGAAARALEELARVQEKIGETNAQAKEKEAEQLDAEAVSLDEQIKTAEQSINNVKAELAKPVTLQLDISEAEKQIKSLQAQIAALSTPKVGAPTESGSTAPTSGSGSGASGSFAVGGYTGPGGKYEPAGVVHAGEYVLRQEVVRQRGMRGLLDSLNRDGARALRGYATGGAVTSIRTSGSVSPVRDGLSDMKKAEFVFPGIGNVPAIVDRQVAESLSRQLRREAVKAGRR
ncbi:MAG: tape measure protein [Methyloversatilis sp.]|nr:tape measure protein [Methyloversatilis sp.]MBP6194378.1 tape measure protein [Methyloversatilis sp.]